MEIKHTLKEARSLTDPICPSGAAAEHWGRGHGEPYRAQGGLPGGGQERAGCPRAPQGLQGGVGGTL